MPDWLRYLYRELDRGGVAAFIALQAREDLERGISCVTGVAQGYYLLYWGWVLQRLGNTRRGLELTEQALEIGQGQDRQLELQALNNMAGCTRRRGSPSGRWSCMSRPCRSGERWATVPGKPTTLNNMAVSVPCDGATQASVGVV